MMVGAADALRKGRGLYGKGVLLQENNLIFFCGCGMGRMEEMVSYLLYLSPGLTGKRQNLPV